MSWLAPWQCDSVNTVRCQTQDTIFPLATSTLVKTDAASSLSKLGSLRSPEKLQSFTADLTRSNTYFIVWIDISTYVGWRERNQHDATNLMFNIKLLSQHVSGIIVSINRRTRVWPASYGVLHCNKRGTKQ